MLHKIGVKLKFSGQVSVAHSVPLDQVPGPATPCYNFPHAAMTISQSLSCAEPAQATISLYPFITRVRSQRLSKSRTSSSEIHKLSFAARVRWTGRVSLLSRSNRPPQSHDNNPHVLLRNVRYAGSDKTLQHLEISKDSWMKRRESICFDILRIYPIIFFSARSLFWKPSHQIVLPDHWPSWSIMGAQWNTNNQSQDYTKNCNDHTITLTRNMNTFLVQKCCQSQPDEIYIPPCSLYFCEWGSSRVWQWKIL